MITWVKSAFTAPRQKEVREALDEAKRDANEALAEVRRRREMLRKTIEEVKAKGNG